MCHEYRICHLIVLSVHDDWDFPQSFPDPVNEMWRKDKCLRNILEFFREHLKNRDMDFVVFFVPLHSIDRDALKLSACCLLAEWDRRFVGNINGRLTGQNSYKIDLW